MKTIKNTLAFAFVFLLCASHAFSQDKPALREIDRLRLAEAFKLKDKLGEALWIGWSKVPFAVLLVTPDREFLIFII